MHIVFFTYDVPFPPNSGGKTRAFNLIKYAGKNAQISLFSFTREGYDLSHLDEIKNIGVQTIELFPRRKVYDLRNLRSLISQKHSIFHSLYFDKNVQKSLFTFVKEKNVDLIQFESFYTGFYISDELTRLGVKQIYGSENIEYRLYRDSLRMFNPLLRPILQREVKKIENEEVSMVKNADTTLAVTNKEARYFQDMTRKPVEVIENGVSVENFPVIKEKKHEKLRLLFIGNFSYFPNTDGLNFFISEIWSKLDRDRFHLTVVGKNVTQLSFLDDSVEKIEYVADIYDAYGMADVFVSPMRLGGGTNFKVLEAMAAGLPVVALKDRAESIEAVHKKEMLIAKNAKEFILCLEELKKDQNMRKELGKNARLLVEKRYSWDIIGKNLYNVWEKHVHEKN